MTDTQSTLNMPAMNPEEFRASPNGHVYGILDNPARDIPAITGDLLASGIALDGIHIYCCNEGIDALDVDGSKHGLRARIHRMVMSVAYEDGHLEQIKTELEAGHALIGVAVDDDRKGEVSKVLHRNGGHDVVYYSGFTWIRLGPGTASEAGPTHD